MSDLNQRVNNVIAELEIINQILEDEDFVCCHKWKLNGLKVTCSFQTDAGSIKEFREGCKRCREQARKRLKEILAEVLKQRGMEVSETGRCPLFKDCAGSCFDTMIEYCLCRNGKTFEDCNLYQEYLAQKVGVKTK